MTAWAYVSGSAFPSCGGTHDVGIRVHGSGGDGTAATAAPVLNTWVQVSGVVSSTVYQNAYMIRFSLYVNCAPSWSGTVYLDDVVIGG